MALCESNAIKVLSSLWKTKCLKCLKHEVPTVQFLHFIPVESINFVSGHSSYSLQSFMKTFSPYKTHAPAKLNLRLKVTGRRSDGYHELVSIMIPIDLADILEIDVIPEGIKLACDGYQVPTDESNLVHKAIKRFISQINFNHGISVKLKKKIPVAAGLGGGSSDAAATLLSLNEICSRPLSLKELQDIAIQLGADVPFFLYCKPCLVRGIGEILEPLDRWPKYYYVIITPPLQVSTAWVYGNLKLELTRGEYDYIVKSLENSLVTISQMLENDLEKVTITSFPIIDRIKKLLVAAGAEGALMSGSGPSVFGVFTSLDQATSAKRSLISQDLGDVFIASDWERN